MQACLSSEDKESFVVPVKEKKTEAIFACQKIVVYPKQKHVKATTLQSYAF